MHGYRSVTRPVPHCGAAASPVRCRQVLLVCGQAVKGTVRRGPGCRPTAVIGIFCTWPAPAGFQNSWTSSPLAIPGQGATLLRRAQPPGLNALSRLGFLRECPS
ncbi:hypothetical protein GCM10022221_22250 [Actinocorallia aurea]